MRVRYLGAAAGEYFEAFRFYEEQEAGVGSAFETELQAALRPVRDGLHFGTLVRRIDEAHEVRQLRFAHRFPYSLIVVVGDGTLACWSQYDGGPTPLSHPYVLRQFSLGLQDGFATFGCGVDPLGNAVCIGKPASSEFKAPLASIHAGRTYFGFSNNIHSVAIDARGRPVFPRTVLDRLEEGQLSIPQSPLPRSLGAIASRPHGYDENLNVCALTLTGEVVCNHPKFSIPEGQFKSIGTSCGVRINGDLACWRDGIPLSIPGPYLTVQDDFRSSSAKLCAIRGDRKVVCWADPYASGNASVLPSTGSAAQLVNQTLVLRTDGKIENAMHPLAVNGNLYQSLDSNGFCGVLQSGAIFCADAMGGRTIPGNFIQVNAVSSGVCGLTADHHVQCFDAKMRMTESLKHDKFDSIGAGCAIRSLDKKVLCMDPTIDWIELGERQN
jgi:hypothetical protein